MVCIEAVRAFTWTFSSKNEPSIVLQEETLELSEEYTKGHFHLYLPAVYLLDVQLSFNLSLSQLE